MPAAPDRPTPVPAHLKHRRAAEVVPFRARHAAGEHALLRIHQCICILAVHLRRSRSAAMRECLPKSTNLTKSTALSPGHVHALTLRQGSYVSALGNYIVTTAFCDLHKGTEFLQAT